MPRPAASCCSAPACCSPGPIVPQLARAEGRDPRFLTIVLRGALDGLAAVAPVGDPDWIKLRGDKALRARRQDAGAAARRLLRAQSGDAEPAPAVSGRPGDRSCMRPRRPIASARISTARTCWKAGCQARRASIPAGSTARSAALEPGGRADARGRQRLCGRAGDAAGGARPGAGAVLDAAAAAAGRATTPPCGCSISIATPTRRSRACSRIGMGLAAIARAGGIEPGARDQAPAVQAAASSRCAPISPRPPARRRNSSPAPTARASARSRSTAGTPTSTRAPSSGRLATLLGALDGAIAAVETNMGDGLARDRGDAGHRVRPHRPHQRQRRHRPRHRHGRAARRRRAQGRPRDRGLAGPQGGRPLREARPQGRPPTCARCSRACSRITCASTTARSPPRCFPAATT